MTSSSCLRAPFSSVYTCCLNGLMRSINVQQREFTPNIWTRLILDVCSVSVKSQTDTVSKWFWTTQRCLWPILRRLRSALTHADIVKGKKSFRETPEPRRTHLDAALVLLFLHDVAALAPFPALVCRASSNVSQPELSCNTFGLTYRHQRYEFLSYFSGQLIKPKQTQGSKLDNKSLFWL